MADTLVTVHIASSGIPTYLAPPQIDTPKWPSASNLLSALLGSVPGIALTPRRETVFLTRSQQRIMNLALRDL